MCKFGNVLTKMNKMGMNIREMKRILGKAEMLPSFSTYRSCFSSDDLFNEEDVVYDVEGHEKDLSEYVGRPHIVDPVLDELYERSMMIYSDGGYNIQPGNFVVEERIPEESTLSRVLPLSENDMLRISRFSYGAPLFPGGIEGSKFRVSTLFETMESFATLTAYEYANGFERGISINCAFCNGVSGFSNFSQSEDIELISRVIWTGVSSLKIEVSATQTTPDNEESANCTMTFTMVCRDPLLDKAMPVHRLVPQTEEERAKYEEVAEKEDLNEAMGSLIELMRCRSERKERRMLSFGEQWEYLENEKENIGNPENLNVLGVSESKFSNVECVYPSQRSIFGRVLGGTYLKKSVDLGILGASAFSGEDVDLISLSDCVFLKQAEIGCQLEFTSRVVYVEKNYMQVRVDCDVFSSERPDKVEKELCSSIQLTLATEKPFQMAVVPETLQDLLLCVEGKKVLHQNIQRFEDSDV